MTLIKLNLKTVQTEPLDAGVDGVVPEEEQISETTVTGGSEGTIFSSIPSVFARVVVN